LGGEKEKEREKGRGGLEGGREREAARWIPFPFLEERERASLLRLSLHRAGRRSLVFSRARRWLKWGLQDQGKRPALRARSMVIEMAR